MKTLKEYYNNYLSNLEKKRESYVRYISYLSIITKSLEYIFGAIIIVLLLLGNVLETELLKELYSIMGFILYLLVFSWSIVKWSKTLHNKVNQWDLGIMQDCIVLLLLTFLNSIFLWGTIALLAMSTNSTLVISVSESMTHLANLLSFLFKISLVVLVVRLITFICLFFRTEKEEKEVLKDKK